MSPPLKETTGVLVEFPTGGHTPEAWSIDISTGFISVFGQVRESSVEGAYAFSSTDRLIRYTVVIPPCIVARHLIAPAVSTFSLPSHYDFTPFWMPTSGWVGETSVGPSTVPPTTTTMVSPTVVPEVPISAAPAEPATIIDKVAEDTSSAEPLVPVPPIMDPLAHVCPHCPHCSYPAKPLPILGDPIDGRPTIRTWTLVDAIIVESEDESEEEEEEEPFEYAPEDSGP